MTNNKTTFGQRLLRFFLICIGSLIFITVAGLLLIAEPWKADQIEHTIPPQTTDMGLIELTLDEEYTFDIKLDDNEIISSIDSQYPTVIEPIGYGVRANGAQIEVDVTVKTREATLSGQKRIMFFGTDYSEPYYNLRLYLRTLFGIENTYTLPSELRILNIYTYRFYVPAYPIEDCEHLTVKVGEYADIAPGGLGEETYSMVKVDDPNLLQAQQMVSNSEYRLTALEKGETEALVLYGFYVTSTEEDSDKTNHFVPVFAKRYPITIK